MLPTLVVKILSGLYDIGRCNNDLNVKIVCIGLVVVYWLNTLLILDIEKAIGIPLLVCILHTCMYVYVNTA